MRQDPLEIEFLTGQGKMLGSVKNGLCWRQWKNQVLSSSLDSIAPAEHTSLAMASFNPSRATVEPLPTIEMALVEVMVQKRFKI